MDEPAAPLYGGAVPAWSSRQSDGGQRDEVQPDEVQPDEVQPDEVQPDEVQSDDASPDEHVRANRALWDGRAADYAARGRRHWGDDRPRWGVWHIPDEEVGMLPAVDGLDVVELGCGTACVSAWLARRGGRVVGLDSSSAQLATARALQHEFDLAFPLVWGDAERAPFADDSFDVAISEYGACLWCDPFRWIPEAARILRPGGRLVFLTSAPILHLCLPEREPQPAGTELVRSYFGMGRVSWPDEAPAVEFHLPHGEMVRLLGRHGFVVEDLHELRPPLESSTAYSFVTLKWARQWPAEEVWTARRSRGPADVGTAPVGAS